MTTPRRPEVQSAATKAAELKRRLLRAATSLSQRPFLDAEIEHIDRTWNLPGSAPVERRDRLVGDAATERLIHAPESTGARSLVDRLLDGDAGVPFDLDAQDRAILGAWRGGGIEAFFEVVRRTDHVAELRCIEDELTYRVVGAVGSEGLGELRRGTLLANRLLQVGSDWILGSPGGVFRPWHRVEVFRDALSQVVNHPERQYRNQDLKALATSLVARHHQSFLRMFGGDVVEGSLDELYGHLERFEAAIGSDGAVFIQTAPARDLAWLEASGAGRSPERVALVHHPIKGLRAVGAYAGLRELHESGRGDPEQFRRWLEDPMLPSWVLARLAERNPRHVVELYGRALARDGFTSDDLAGYLATREPSVDPTIPGIVLVPAWVDEAEVA